MTIKITLITPPDIFENENDSLLIANLTESEQTMASDWLGKFDSNKNFNNERFYEFKEFKRTLYT